MGSLNIFVYLAISIILSLIAGKVMKVIKLPNVTGYLIIGLLAGPYCLNLIPLEAVEKFSIIPEMALGFIAFSIGAEFKISYLKKVGKTPVIIACLAALITTLAVDIALIATGNNVGFSLILGAIAAATAPAATLMVIRQYKASGPVTDMLLPVVAIDDAAAIFIFGISVAIAKIINSTGDGSLGETLVGPLIEIFGAIILGSLLGIILTFLTKWFTGRGNRLSITIAMVLLCVGVSDLTGVSSLLACMSLSAIYVNTSRVCDKVFEQVDRMTPPLFMLFFFISGAELDITILPTVGVIGVLYIISRSVGKILGAAFAAKISNAEPAVRKYLGFTMLPQAGVAIGLAGVAMTVVPEYGGEVKAIVLSATVVYEVFGPVITKLALIKAREIKKTA